MVKKFSLIISISAIIFFLSISISNNAMQIGISFRDCAREIEIWPIVIHCQPRTWRNCFILIGAIEISSAQPQSLMHSLIRTLHDSAVSAVTGERSLLRPRTILFGPCDFGLYGEINFPAGRHLSYYVITRLMGEVPSFARGWDRRRHFLFRVNLSRMKFICSLLRRFVFRIGCVRARLHKLACESMRKGSASL